MSRRLVEVASVQFQVESRQANATMQALQQKVMDLNAEIGKTQVEIDNLGKVPIDDKEFVRLDNLLRKLKSDLKDVNTTMKDYTRGVKAADQLLMAYDRGNIEGLSMKAIKAGQNGLRKRIENIDPDKANAEELKSYRIIQEVIRESQRVVDDFKVDAEKAIQTIKDGGVVSEKTLRQTRDGLRDLKQSVEEGTKEWQTYDNQLTTVSDKLQALGMEEARRTGKQTLGRAFRGDFATADVKTIEQVIAKLKEYQSVIEDPGGKGARIFAATDTQIKNLKASLEELKNSSLRGDAQKIFGDRSTMSEAELRRAVEAAKEYQQTLTASGPLHQQYSRAIAETEEYLKQYSVESERAKVKQEALDRQMRDRMHELPKLTESALAETKKYWEDMMRTQGLAEQKLSSYRIQLEKLIAEERRRKEVQAERVIGNMGASSDEEIKKAIQAFEQLRDAQAHGNDEWRHYNERVQEGKRYLDEWAKTDSVIKFEGQMQKLPQLSDAALQETKKFWETMVAGAEKGSQELKDYEANLEKVKQEERERRQLNDDITAQRLNGNLSHQSEQEINEAIEAAKRLIKTYETASPEAAALAKRIADAEEHVKKYGLEAERAARREAKAVADAAKKRKETDDLMKQQLQQGTSLSKEALHAQEQYWQRLINDPKTAAASLQDYQQQLDNVRQLQRRMIAKEGNAAFNFFDDGEYQNASANEIKRQADALKLWRDSLPQKDNASLIKLIDELLQKAGQSAKKAAEQTMSWKQAMQVSSQAGTGSFRGTVEQLTQAKKVLEEMSAKAVKGGLAWRRMQEALQRIEIELKNVGHLSQEVQAVLDKPKGRSYNQLKQAVEQGRAALNAMDRTTREGQKAFDELAKKVKAADLEMKQLAGTAKGTVSAFDKAWSRLKTYVGLYVGASVAMNKMMGTMGDLMDLSDRMGEVRKTTGFTADEVGRLTTSLKKLDTRTSIVGLLDLSAAAGQLGLKTQEDVEGFTIAANKLMVALPEMGREGATEMLKVALATGEIDKIRRQMEEGLIDGSSATAVAMEKVGSTIDRLRATSAATAPAITDFVKRVGAVGAQSGITIDQVAALGSTVDALGMRVEMSATALSRMIPAIRNNAYNIGAMIGQTEEEIINKFDNGMGMDVILDIFETIRNNSRAMTGDVEQDAGEIEKMFERAGLQDIMKELNQMGARAGIVFAGLSQNVDELRRQLGVAAEAYEDNIAIEQEYQKMNDTTAAKWERLKNQLEEAFVGDTAQRWLGGIIDMLRGLVDFITGKVDGALGGLRVAFLSLTMAVAAYRMQLGKMLLMESFGGIAKLWKLLVSMKDTLVLTAMYTKEYIALKWQLIFAHGEETKALIREKIAQLGLNKAMAANVYLAVATAIVTAYMALKDWTKGNNAATKAVEELNQKVDEEKRKLNALFNAYYDANGNVEKRKNLMNEINKKYSQYLGFLLTDAENSNLVAAAHERIAAALEKEMLERERAQTISGVRQKFQDDLTEEWSKFTDELRSQGLSSEQIAQARNDIQAFLQSLNTNNDKILFSGNTLTELNQYVRSRGDQNTWIPNKDEEVIVATWVDKYLRENYPQVVSSFVSGVGKDADGEWNDLGGPFVKYAETYLNMIRQVGKAEDQISGFINAAEQSRVAKSSEMITNLQEQATKAAKIITDVNSSEEDIAKAYEHLAGAVEGLSTLSDELKTSTRQADQTAVSGITSFVTGLFRRNPTIDTQKVQNARTRQQSLLDRILNPIDTNANGNGDSNDNPRGPYGNYDKRVDPYEQWDANALVKRREDMLKRVRALASGADVQQVLSMDKRFMDEATRKGIKNMRDAIAWYNEERLKIQEELHNRNLTNEGQWMDPKKGRSRKPKTPESEEAIAELDRYYLERKERIEEARANEEMTEAEYNRRLDALEQEHLERRSALRQTFTSEDKQFIQQFRQWWASVAELDEVSWETIEAEWIAAFDRDRKYNNRAAQKDLTAMKAITVKQLREIEAIIDKERPFNGITRNLQDNLTKMGILFKDGVDDSNFMEQNTKRLTFLLREAEDAYNMTWEQLERDMRENGLGAWADAIVGSNNAEKEKRAVIAQLHEVYDAVQEAIKKEASLVKKQVDITWNDALLPNGKSIKQTYEAAISQLGVQQGSVSRANSLIGAGTASARVADRLAIRQMQIQLQMQEHYYNLVRQTGMQRIADLREQARQLREQNKLEEAARLDLDAQHATMSLNLSLSKEQTELDKQREEIIARTEESQNRLYTSLREWAELLSSSVQSLFEASHAGDAEYYNEMAKLSLTGKGGPGAGTYVVIDDAGTSDAKAHYEYLDERQALERQREIERENAQAEARRKVMDDLNAKMNEQITDWINAALQNASIDANTDATLQNTDALAGLTNAIAASSSANAVGTTAAGAAGTATPVAAGDGALSPAEVQEWTDALGTEPWLVWEQAGVSAMQHVQQATTDTSKRMQASTQSAFAKMTQAANLYGIAYSAMSNDNLNTMQKFSMMAIQAAGQSAITALTVDFSKTTADAAMNSASVLGKLWSQLGWGAVPVYAIFTGLLGGLMGLAASKIAKSKSEIAQATGVGANAGKLTTGMLTYAEGNVNEFTDPASLTPGRQYNVDGADGKTYRARYMGKGAKTHITNGPEFHLVGEAGREAIIDAKTTRQIQMDEPGIWQAIKTLYRGGRLSPVRRRGMAAFADGNIDELEEMGGDGIAAYGTGGAGGMSPELMAAFQSSLDRNNELLERALKEGFKGVFDVHGAHGLVNTYDTAKKEALRHGERYT